MSKFLAAIVAAITLFVAAEAKSCESVQAIVTDGYVANEQIVAPVVYKPVVQRVFVQPVVASYSTPVVQQVVVRQRVVNRRQPLRRAAQVVLPPYGCR